MMKEKSEVIVCIELVLCDLHKITTDCLSWFSILMVLYFITCSGWTPTFQHNHWTRTIPDYANEVMVTKLMAGKVLLEGSDKDTLPCSHVILPHIGMKIKTCCKYSVHPPLHCH